LRQVPRRSRALILEAAVREFSKGGIAGARTEAIAKMAGVNKALLHYYFKDKEGLYGAVLEEVFGGLRTACEPAWQGNSAPMAKLLAYVECHFDYVAAHPLYPRILQCELLRVGAGEGTRFGELVQSYFGPIYARLEEVIREGIAGGEFRPVDPRHFISSMTSVIVCYFNSAPVIRLVAGIEPFEPERIAERRAAVLDFIAAALGERPFGKLERARA
jgi:TetR/AcrR family transcriptional regulator